MRSRVPQTLLLIAFAELNAIRFGPLIFPSKQARSASLLWTFQSLMGCRILQNHTKCRTIHSYVCVCGIYMLPQPGPTEVGSWRQLSGRQSAKVIEANSFATNPAARRAVH